jgi:rhodanese-related sulfurtransferase
MKSIARDDVQNLMGGDAYLIEVLPVKEYDEVHLAHAKNIPLKQLNRANVAGLESTRPVIVYCYDYQ